MEIIQNGVHGQGAQKLAAMELNLIQEIVQILDHPVEDECVLEFHKSYSFVILIHVPLVSFNLI